MSQLPFPPPPPPGPSSSGLASPPRYMVTDHPLAAAATSPVSAPGPQYPRPPVAAPTSQPPYIIMAAATPKVFRVGPPNQSLDAMADDFLSAAGTLPNPKLRPLPLPTGKSELDRVRALVVRRAWGDVLALVHQLLRGPSSHYTPIYTGLLQGQSEAVDSLDSLRDDVVELLVLQIHAWLKMRRYNEMGHELRQWKFLEVPPDWIPAGLRLLAAAAWSYVPPDLGGGAPKALDVLYALRSEYYDNPTVSVTVEYHLANVLCRQQSWRMALQAYDRLLELLPVVCSLFAQQHFSAENCTTIAPVIRVASQCEVWSRQGRIFLQTGALEAAGELFAKAQQTWRQVSFDTLPEEIKLHPWIAQQVPAQVLYTNAGLLAFSYRHYEQASEDFRKALDTLNQTWSVDGSYCRDDWVGGWTILPPQNKETLYAETMNNLSVAALYSCRLHDAISVLEGLIRTDPTCFLTERMALNLCTLYELSADTTVANRKKRTLQLIAKRFFLHDVGPESFRIGP